MRSHRSRRERTCSTSTPGSHSPTSRPSSPATIQLVQGVTDVPLSIDSSIIEALEAGLAVYQGKPLVNSVTGEDEVMERVLPLVAKYGAAVVAISNDETGISEDPDVRFAVAKKIVERAADHGIPASDVVVDPLVMPIGAMGTAGQQAFRLLRRLREELRVNTTCGASNVSFGLPNRHVITGTFLSMAIASGMTSAIMNPLHAEVKSAVMAADVLMGTDRDCAAWIQANRDPDADAGARGATAAVGDGRRGEGNTVPDSAAQGQFRVVFTPSGLTGVVERGTTVLDAARRLGVDLDTVCGGRGVCGRCQVVPAMGSFPKWGVDAPPDAWSAPAERGSTTAGTGRWRAVIGWGAQRRSRATSSSTCRRRARSTARSSARISTSRGSRSTRRSRSVTSRWSKSNSAMMPASRTWCVRRSPHSTGARATVPLRALGMLQPAIAQGGGAVTVAIDEHDRVVAVWPGFVGEAFGVAVDIGSTTIAGHLCDLTTGDVLASAGRMNPQIRFGEDLMSRVSYVMMHPGGERRLTQSVRTAVDGLIGELVDQVATFREYVLEVVLVGNPIMHHLLLGLDPTPLGQAPFTLTTNRALVVRAADLELTLPFGRCYVGPCIAGHVGADTTAAILAERPYQAESVQLLVDVGTNAEIVLGNRDGLFAASSPTGPAFEGAQISSGQRATVERSSGCASTSTRSSRGSR